VVFTPCDRRFPTPRRRCPRCLWRGRLPSSYLISSCVSTLILFSPITRTPSPALFFLVVDVSPCRPLVPPLAAPRHFAALTSAVPTLGTWPRLTPCFGNFLFGTFFPLLSPVCHPPPLGRHISLPPGLFFRGSFITLRLSYFIFSYPPSCPNSLILMYFPSFIY